VSPRQSEFKDYLKPQSNDGSPMCKFSYGLYGKCGSGKTTALSCLLGIQSLDSGNIFVRGLKTGSKGSGIPGKRIGYMPQSTSLHEELNMRETLDYYGRIYGMSYEDVEEKRRYFIDLLQLEPCKSQIRNLR